jgi:hypothetical protein
VKRWFIGGDDGCERPFQSRVFESTLKNGKRFKASRLSWKKWSKCHSRSELSRHMVHKAKVFN